MGEKLKPCPFCGGEAFVNDDPTDNGAEPLMSKNGKIGLGRLWSVECDECGADGGFWQGRDIAIKAWNTRTPETCHREIESGAFICSECGGSLPKWMTNNYCHTCGRKVVDV